MENGVVQHHYAKYLNFLPKHAIYLPFDVGITLQHRISCGVHIKQTVRYAVILTDIHLIFK